MHACSAPSRGGLLCSDRLTTMTAYLCLYVTTPGFQVWDTVQAVSSYVRGMLSSQAVMTGIGVGKEVRACGQERAQRAVQRGRHDVRVWGGMGH